MSTAQQAEERRQRVYSMLCEMAERGEPTPTYRHIAEVADTHTSGAGKILEILESRGLIRRLPGFVIHVRAVGKSTKATDSAGRANPEKLREQEAMMLKTLRRFLGQRLPTNAKLGELAGLSGETAAGDTISRLRIAGTIKVEGRGVIRILRAIYEAQPIGNDSLRRVDSSICPRCGVRAEAHEQFGCARRLAA